MDSDSEDDSYILRAERQAKQDYLKEEILEMYYDPDLFMDYCESIREANIDAWDFSELQECVRNFKTNYRPGETLQEVREKQAKKKPINAGEIISYSQEISKGSDSEEETHDPQKMMENIEVAVVPHLGEKNEKKNLKIEVEDEIIRSPHPSPAVSAPTPRFLKSSEGSFKIQTLEEHDQASLKELNSEPNDDHQEVPIEEGKEIPQEELEFSAEEFIGNTRNTEESQPKLEILPCSVLQETELTLLCELEVIVDKPEVVNTGRFTRSFVLYEVSLPQLGWIVKRRYNDFVWLRNLLSLTNPASYLPPVPSKKYAGNFSQRVLKKRQLFLTNFINDILRKPILRSSPHLLEFLRNDNSEDFVRYKLEKENLQKSNKLDEIFTLEGDTICDFSENNSEYKVMHDYLQLSEQLEGELKESMKDYIESTYSLSRSIEDFSDSIQDLQVLQDALPGNSENSELYELVQSAVFKWAVHEEVNARNYDEDLRLHIGYKIQEKPILKALIDERDQHLSNVKKFQKRKGCEAQLEQVRNMFGHCNHKIPVEIEETLGDHILKDTKHYSKMSHSEINKLLTLQDLWEFTSTKFYRAPKII